MSFEVFPESPFLSELAEGLKKRRKSLSHGGGSITCERVQDRSEGVEREKLEVVFKRRPNIRSVSVRLFVWSDRWAWIDAREPTKNGWKWEWAAQGRLLGPDVGVRLAMAFQSTVTLSKAANSSIADELTQLWSPLLAKGPEAA